jgi:hypothetical protein
MNSGSESEVIHQTCLDVDRAHGGARQIAGGAGPRQQPGKAGTALRRRIQPGSDVVHVIGFERRGIAAGGGYLCKGYQRRYGCLAAGGVVCAIVEQQVLQV